MTQPRIVTREEWEAALARLRAKEKELTRAHDALAAERRRLPWVRIETDYVFQGPDGKARLVDLFDGRRQLLIYHFMFGPTRDAGCPGCTMFVDQIGHLAHLHARDTSFARSAASALRHSCWETTEGVAPRVVIVPPPSPPAPRGPST